MTFYTGVEELVIEFPAYNVYRRGTHTCTAVEHVTDISVNDVLILATETGAVTTYRGRYQAGSVISYALRNNSDPIEALDQAALCEERLHWISQLSTCITDKKYSRDAVIEVTVGMRVRFEGVLFTIESAPNENLKLTPIED